MKTLTVVCPVYNEEEVIGAFYEELAGVLATVGGSYRSKILFVVDRCEDATVDVLREIARRDRSVEVIVMSSRFGHQMSLLAGIDYSRSDVVIMMDSDLQHPPQLIPQMLQAYESGYDIVMTVRQDSPEIGFFKRATSRFFYRMINLISETPINESAADFRLISRRVAEVFQTQIRERNQFLRGLFGWVGFKTTTIPFAVRKRGAGKSKYSVKRMISFGIDGVVSFSKSPLQAAIILGLVFAFLGFVLILVTVAQYFVYSALPPGWATLTILLSVFSGIQLIFLGILGEYVGAIFDEVKGRPHYIVDATIGLDDEQEDS